MPTKTSTMNRTGLRTAVAVAMLLGAFCIPASALNPSLDVDQYAHHSWTVRDGFFNVGIVSITQTSNGYLWLGTEFGVLRFDGVRALPLQPGDGEKPPAGPVYTLLGGRNGRLWIGGRDGLASWMDGKLSRYPDLADQFVSALIEDRDGTVWAGGSSLSETAARICSFRGGVAQCYGQDGSFGHYIGALFEFGGYLWVGLPDKGLWRWKPGPVLQYPMPFASISHWQSLSEGESGELLVATLQGLYRVSADKIEPYSLPGAGPQIAPTALLRDRDGSLWIGTAGQGLLHVHRGRTDRFSRSDGLSADTINTLFEDREGSIWVATNQGLDCFREFAVPTISVNQGLAHPSVFSVQAAKDGSIWIGSRGGLDRWRNGAIEHYFGPGRPEGVPESIFQDDRGRIWVSSIRRTFRLEDGRFLAVDAVPPGQTHWISQDTAGDFWFGRDGSIVHMKGNAAQLIPSTSIGHQGNATVLLADPARGGLWIGFFEGGLVYLQDGQVRGSYAPADGLGEGAVGGIQLDRDGTVWAATEGGLSRIRNGRIATLTARNGLPCDAVHWAMEDNNHAVWLYLGCGLVRIARSDLDSWAANPARSVQTTVFDSSDGVALHSFMVSGYSPRVTMAQDGALWFVSGNGVSVIDPRHLAVNPVLPPVEIEQIAADRKIYWRNSSGAAPPNLRLPPLVRDLQIDFTALSYAAPEKVHFRYKLEGQDRDWKEVVNVRQAQYSNLGPRAYRFRVIASNNSGVWNETGNTIDFSIDPAYYQTRWFQSACLAAFLALLFGLYRYRLYQVARQFNMRLEERVGERTRLARDLHDTLLQSFQGALFEFQAARNLLSRRPEQAMQTLDNAILSAESAIAEGRDAIQDLRTGSIAQGDLAQLLRDAGKELSAAQPEKANHAAFRVTVEGPEQTLLPILQDELYRIGREILRNAFRHAQAKRIEVEIRYEMRAFLLRIRDDGIGIDPKVLALGARPGHWGLPGVRERAKLVGARLDFWSEVGAGTEVQVSVPAPIAYGKSKERRAFRFFE